LTGQTFRGIRALSMKSIFKGLSPQSAAFLIVLALLGATLTASGLALRSSASFASNLFISLGGSALGSALSISFVRIFEPSQLRTLIEQSAEANRSSILSTGEEKYAFLRKRMHGYLRSRNADGSCVWRYRIFDFSASYTPGHLHAVVDVPSSQGRVRKFIYDGYVCGDHLVLIGQPMEAATEQHVVHMFPDAIKSVQYSTVSGLCFVDSYDGKKLVTPSVLSDEALTTQKVAGPVPEAEAAVIYDRWKNQMGDRQLNLDPNTFRVVKP
jgi:hypothetical protein